MYPRRSARLLAKNNKVPPDTDVVMKEESPGMEAEETPRQSTKIYAWGCAVDGRTATDSAPNDFVDTPTCINIPYNVTIKAISAGRRHSGALTHCGRILLWGSNKERQLARRLPGQLFWDDLETESDEYEGKGPTKDPFTSIPEFLPTAKQVFFEGFACGDSFTIAFTNDRVSQTTHIYVFGSFVRRSVPEGIYQSIPWGKKGKVVQVVAPTMHAMLLTEKGYLYAAGQYRSRQLGTPRGAVNVPMHTSKCALFDPVILPDDVRVAQIACGGYHTVVLTTNKQIYVWGDNRYGQFGCPTATATLQTLHPSLTNMDMVCAGANHTLAVGADGKLFGFGRSIDLPYGPPTNSFKPNHIDLGGERVAHLAAGFSSTVIVTETGRVLQLGTTWNTFTADLSCLSRKKVVALSHNYYHALALVVDIPPVLEGISTIYSMRGYSNVDIVIGGSIVVPSHIVVLATVAPSLATFLTSTSDSSRSRIELNINATELAVRHLIQLIYGEPVRISDLHEANSLIALARFSGVDWVADAVCEGLGNSISKPPLWVDVNRNWFTERYQYLLDSGEHSDITLVAHTEPTRAIKAHRLVLSARSAKFASMFGSGLAESSQDIVELSNVTFDQLEELVAFIYTDKLNLTGENVMEMFSLSREYMVPCLERACEDFVVPNLSTENILDTLIAADLMHAGNLKISCFRFLKKYLDGKPIQSMGRVQLPDLVVNEYTNFVSQ